MPAMFRIMGVIPMFDETEEVWMYVLPVYLRLGIEEVTAIRAHFRDTHS